MQYGHPSSTNSCTKPFATVAFIFASLRMCLWVFSYKSLLEKKKSSSWKRLRMTAKKSESLITSTGARWRYDQKLSCTKDKMIDLSPDDRVIRFGHNVLNVCLCYWFIGIGSNWKQFNEEYSFIMHFSHAYWMKLPIEWKNARWNANWTSFIIDFSCMNAPIVGISTFIITVISFDVTHRLKN